MRSRTEAELCDSQISWLPRVPAFWRQIAIKRVALFQVGWTPSTAVPEYFQGDLPWVSIGDMKQEVVSETKSRITLEAVAISSMTQTPKGSLLFSFKLSVGNVAFAGCDLYTNEAIASFLPSSQIDLQYLYYAAPIFVSMNASTNIYGARILNQELIGNAQVALPGVVEQRQIAGFLQYETARIDTLIAKQKQLIELLKEKRQAVISQAVTKGLDPDVPMKDSGVEWLGEVPAHWRVVQLRRVLVGIEQGVSPVAADRPPGDNECGVLKLNAVKSGHFDELAAKTLDSLEDFEPRFQVKIGDLLVTRANTPFLVADACFVSSVQSRVMLCDLIYRLLPDGRLSTSFARYLLISDGARFQVSLDARGSSMSMAKVAQSHIRGWRFAVPTIDEQRNIVREIECAFRAIDSAVECVRNAIQLLAERRTALISAAVTGQIDVTTYQSSRSDKASTA